MATKIYILLPVHNRCAITRHFIESLVRQEYRNYHLVLIDDGSTDGTEQMVHSYLDDLTVIRGKGDWWWGGSLHQGYLWLQKQDISADDVVLIINDDTEIEPDYLLTALEILWDHPHALLVTRCYNKQTNQMVDAGAYYLDFAKMTFTEVDDKGDSNCCSTRGLFVKATDMIAIGRFHPILLPHYLSDIEYTHRADKKGMKLLSNARLRLYLNEEATGFHYQDYNTSSSLLKIKRHFSKKSSDNPIYWSNFMLLSCPWKYKLKNFFGVWAGAAGFLVKLGCASRSGSDE